MDNQKKIGLALISGVLLFLSFPKYGEGIVAWFALVPLLFVVPYNTVRSGLMTGFIAGLVFNIGLIYWVSLVIVNYGNLPWAIAVLAMLFLAAYLSLYVAVFSGALVYFRNRNIPPIVAAPLLWTCLEYVKSHILTGFPWENLAYSQASYTSLIQIADITGLYGITFIIVMINVILYDLLFHCVQGINDRPPRSHLAIESLCGIILLSSLWLYGNVRIDQVEQSMRNATRFNTALIQGNIDQSIKWNPQFQQRTLNIYQSLSKLSKLDSGLIIWPETASPFYFQEMGDLSREVVQVAKETGNWLLFGSPSYSEDKNGTAFFNSAFLLSPEGIIAGRYDKVHLVPYGEYVPLRRYFPFVNKLVQGIGDFSEGRGYYPVSLHNKKVGILICYEAILPEASRAYKRRGAEVLVNITNDAWFGRSSAPYQHLSMTALRAVENRLYVLRAANTGISAIIDPTGKIVSRTDIFTTAGLTGEARFIDNSTLYVAYGDTFAYVCMVLLLLCLLLSRRGENNVGGSENDHRRR